MINTLLKDSSDACGGHRLFKETKKSICGYKRWDSRKSQNLLCFREIFENKVFRENDLKKVVQRPNPVLSFQSVSVDVSTEVILGPLMHLSFTLSRKG